MAEIEPGEVVLYLLVNLAIIIGAARVMGMAARRIGQPAVIGEITAGVLLGPTVLGRINADWPGEIFPPGVPLEQIASLGLVFFMFLVGLELDLSVIRSQARKAVQISLAGIAVPLSLGILLALALFSVNQGGEFRPLEPGAEPISKATFALFIGAAMCITAFPVLARMLVETGLYRTSVGTTTLCAGAVDDVVAWILLAGVVGIAQGGSPASAGQAFALTALFAVFMATAGRWALGKLAERHEATGRLTVDQVAIVLAGVLLSAYATELIGVHSIFGAFIFGAVMPKRAGMTHQLTDKIEDFTVIVLLPVFFLVAGLRTDLFKIDSPALVGWTLLILAVATLGKFAGCGIAALLTGTPRREAVVIGALMNTRGLTELVILTIGLELGVLSDRTFAMMVVMALMTTVIAAPVVSRLMPRELVLARMARGDRPAPTAARILIAATEAAPVGPMTDMARRLVGDRRPAEVLFLRPLPVTRAAEVRSGLTESEMRAEEADSELTPFVEQLAADGITARTIVLLSEDPVADIATICEEQPVDTVLVGWGRAPAERLRWRRLSRRLMRRVPGDVAALASGTANDLAAVAVLTSGGSHDTATLEIARLLAGHAEPVSLKGSEEVDGTRGLVVVAAPDDWPASPEFGRAAGVALEATTAPVLIVRAADGTGAPGRAGSGPSITGWPFAVPVRPRGELPIASALTVPHLQLLDEYGVALDARPVRDNLSIGRAEDNDFVVVADPLVSRRHAELRTERGAVKLVDMQSTNGTLVWRDGDWLPVHETALHGGDLLIIGANVFRYRTGEAGEDLDGDATTT